MMKKFRIVHSGMGNVEVEAEDEEQAEDMFMDGRVDFDFSDGATVDYIEEVTESQTSPGEITGSDTGS